MLQAGSRSCTLKEVLKSTAKIPELTWCAVNEAFGGYLSPVSYSHEKDRTNMQMMLVCIQLSEGPIPGVSDK